MSTCFFRNQKINSFK